MVSGFKIKVDKEELIRIIDTKLDEIATQIFTKSQENVVEMKIIDRGTLLQTANVNRLPLEKTIIYPVFYADDVHFGRLPGDLPPIESIKGWVRRKLQVKDEKEVTKIAWAIGKHIEKYGTEPRPFLMNAVDSVKQELKG